MSDPSLNAISKMAQPLLDQQNDVHPDDVAIYEQLAKLQGMHNQVSQIRRVADVPVD